VRSPQPAVQAPPAEVVVHSLPGRVLPREHPPGAAAPQEVEHGVGDVPGRPLRRSATPLRGREKRLQQGPLFVGKVGRIRATDAGHSDLQKLEQHAFARDDSPYTARKTR
jgi:hypothetical protein